MSNPETSLIAAAFWNLTELKYCSIKMRYCDTEEDRIAAHDESAEFERELLVQLEQLSLEALYTLSKRTGLFDRGIGAPTCFIAKEIMKRTKD